jgi:EAL and modified HD-GYP domain-containing signal transduction protein
MGHVTNMSDDSGLAWLAAAVDAAIPEDLRREWAAHVSRVPVLVARQPIFSQHGRIFAYQLSFRSPDHHSEPASAWGEREHERATEHVLAATFGRADLERVARGRLLFVRCPRAFLVGDLPLPHRPDRLVLEVCCTDPPDAEVTAGLRRLRAEGFRIALPAFADRPGQREYLPFADFVKLDARDLDVEGEPVVRAARAHGALLVGEYVEDQNALRHARELGLTLFQGNLLARAGILDRSDARPVLP